MSINDAIVKINTEMQKKPDDMYVEMIGHHVIDRINTLAAAEAVMREEVTLAGALEAVQAEAVKIKKGNVAVMADAQVYKIVDDYFELADAAPAEDKKIDIDFDAFL